MLSSAPPAPRLEICGLAGGYEPLQVFRDINLRLGADESIGLFGPNGHGKTTLMLTISGVLSPWRGDIWFCGERLSHPTVHGSRRLRHFNYEAFTRRRINPCRTACAGLIHVAQGNLLFGELSVDETLSIAAQPARKGGRAAEIPSYDQLFALFPDLLNRRAHKTRFLSGGERQMLALASAMLAVPRLLILDEPTLGLSPKMRRILLEAVQNIRATGVPLIVIDQDINFLKSLVQRLYLFDHGRISGCLEHADIPDAERLMSMLFGHSLTQAAPA